MLRCISKWFLFPPAGRKRRFFCDSYCGHIVELLEGNLPNQTFWKSPCYWIPLEFLTLWFVYSELLAIHPLQLRFSYPVLVLSTVSGGNSLSPAVSSIWRTVVFPESSTVIQIQESLLTFQSLQPFFLVLKHFFLIYFFNWRIIT